MVSISASWPMWSSGLLLLLVTATAQSPAIKTSYDLEQKQRPRDLLRKKRPGTAQLNQRRQQFMPLDLSWSGDEFVGRSTESRNAHSNTHPLERDADENESRIIGGRAAAPGAFPFFVQWSRGCGGSLIAKDLVLSAAHCYSPNSNANTVWVGGIRTEQARQRSIVEVRVHPQYDPDREAYDFVILRLDEEIRGAIQPVTLNTAPGVYRTPINGEALTVVGYGVMDVVEGISSQTLLQAEVNYIGDCSASSAYQPGEVQEDIMFCAGVPQGQVDSCQGDSGGPILDAQNRQVGIVSFGRGCGEAEYPGVYARISSVAQWIENIQCMSVANTPSDCIEITIDVKYDAYPIENSWALYGADDQMIYQVRGGEVTQPGHAKTTLKVRPGPYKFIMFDKVGDGICCVYGDGFVTITTNTETLEAAGDFAFNTELQFTVTAPTLPWGFEPFGDVVRNPTGLVALRLTIAYDNHPSETSWQLMNDNDGRIIAEVAPNSITQAGETITYEYLHLTAGHYWFSITDSSHDGICCRSGFGYVRIDQIDTSGNFIGNKANVKGDFGDFAEVDFLVDAV